MGRERNTYLLVPTPQRYGSCGVNGSFNANTHITVFLSALFEVLVDTADGEL